MPHFNRDTEALKKRVSINTIGAKYNLEDWIISLLPPLKGLQALDLGCGTGKQLFRFSPLITDEGQILGIDISRDALSEVMKLAKVEGLLNIEVKEMNIEDCVDRIVGKSFDLIISSYAIYYVKNLTAMLKRLRTLLTEKGVVFICGPGKGTNCEMIKIINEIDQNLPEQPKIIEDFIGYSQILEAARAYSSFRISRLENQINYYNATDVISWWKNHNSFNASIATKVEEFFKDYFRTKRIFTLTKNVLGVRFDV